MHKTRHCYVSTMSLVLKKRINSVRNYPFFDFILSLYSEVRIILEIFFSLIFNVNLTIQRSFNRGKQLLHLEILISSQRKSIINDEWN